MKKASIIFGFIIAVIGIFLAGYLISRISTEEQQITGGDEDEHGCIGSAGYSWCEEKQECLRFWEVKCDEAQMNTTIQKLGDDLIENTSIEFLMFSETEFNWITKDGDVEVSGLTISFEDAPPGLYQEIRDYLKSVGFESDVYNMRDGTVVSGEGYQKALTVCQLEVGLMATDEIDFNGPVRVTLSCGLLDEI